MGSQQFCLKWNNHQSNMLAVFEQLLSNEALVDVTLACEGLSLKAHKMVLSACSPFFQSLFVENPCKHPIVIMKDMRYMDLKAIVEFMYRGEVNVSQDHLTALLKTAETLKVKGLAEVTSENKHGGLVSVDGAADAKPVGTPRAESPPLSKRKRGRPRRRSPSDSNKSDSEDAPPPATRIKRPDSPEIIEDGSLSSDRVVTALPAASPSSRTCSNVAAPTTAVPSGARLVSSVQATTSSQHTQDSIGDDVGEGDDADFDVEPLNVMEQSMTTENVPVFPDVASSSQALGDESQQSHHTGSTSDNSALVPVHPSLPSDISITSQVDIKPSPSSLIPYDDQTISPVVAAPPAAALSGDGTSTAMQVMDASGVPAIAGPSSYQQSTPSHGSVIAYSEQDTPHGRDPAAGQGCPVSHCSVSTPTSADNCRDKPTRMKLHMCSYCRKCFLERRVMLDHLRTHIGERRYGCNHCGSAFASKYNLVRHIRTHTGDRPYSCEYCSSHFSRKAILVAHLRSHTGERPYRCDHCGSAFASKDNLVRHLRTHTGERPYSCEYCSSHFSDKRDLVKHRRSHTGERPYRCDHCGYSFTQSGALLKHLRKHTGERPYRCDHCGSAFASKENLVRHTRTHTGERPHQCELCPMAFVQKVHLLRHVRSHEV